MDPTGVSKSYPWGFQQLEGGSAAVPPDPVTRLRPNGETVEIVHTLSRLSMEIAPPLTYGRPDYGTWAGLTTPEGRDAIINMTQNRGVSGPVMNKALHSMAYLYGLNEMEPEPANVRPTP